MGGEVSQRLSVITLEGCDPKARWHRAAKLFRLCLKPRSLEKTDLWLLGADWLTFAHENRSCFPPNTHSAQRKQQRDLGFVHGAVGCGGEHWGVGGLFEGGVIRETMLPQILNTQQPSPCFLRVLSSVQSVSLHGCNSQQKETWGKVLLCDEITHQGKLIS